LAREENCVATALTPVIREAFDGWVDSIYRPDISARCIFVLTSFPVLFSIQFNPAPTEGNYLQLFLARGRLFRAPRPGLLLESP
jgi:hypothetical protein